MTDRDRLKELINQGDKKCGEMRCEECEHEGTEKCGFNLIADYLLANGVIVPPVKVGYFVYALWSVPTETKYIVYCAEVKKISQYKKNFRLTTVFEIEPIEFRGRRKEFRIDDFGKWVFLTKEEAEAELRKIGEDNA